ncbi:MAG: hypothetical protein FJ333_03200 [Sphingomonadales bacterium]|nr:hypothetical protein [Sphingomonadales bacterium]
MSFRAKGASQGKPHFFTQALGIPVVAVVFISLRLLLLKQFSHDAVSVTYDTYLGFGGLTLVDFMLLGCCIWVYAVDFFIDGLRWDAQGFSMRPWQVVWAIVWGLMPILGLSLVALGTSVFVGKVDGWFLFGAFRWVVLGGMGYLLVRWLGGKMAAILGPCFIAITFAFALFWDVLKPWEVPLWRQGVLVFIFNVWVMQWFELDKDGVSNSTNVWRSVDPRWMKFWMAVVSLALIVLWGGQAQRSWGLPALLFVYFIMMLCPIVVRPFRMYRLLIDGMLLLWLL